MGNMNETENEMKSQKLEKRLEIIVAIFLAVTALLSSWSGWIGSLHGGNQATNYTTSNNIAADGNSRYVEATQNLNQDMTLWNNISDLYLDICFDLDDEDDTALEKDCYKLYYTAYDNLSDELAAAIDWDFDEADQYADDPAGYVLKWMETDGASSSPFADQDFIDSYYEDAESVISESETYLEEGKTDNTRGDSFNFVTVFYSLVLFLLGISATFKNLPCRTGVVIASIVIFALATIYMLTIPMPTGFDITSFFQTK